MAIKSDERTQLEHVEQDLLRQFPDLPQSAVSAEFVKLVRQFDEARIRTYIPVLVAKQARSHLRAFPASR